MMRRFFILRGVQGSGKSTLADDLVLSYPHSRVVGTDSYWTLIDGEYRFDPRKLREAHEWCFERFRDAIRDNHREIILDNTNIKTTHFEKYVEYAEAHGYTVIVISISPPPAAVGAERNVHGVSEEVVARGIAGFEPWAPKV